MKRAEVQRPILSIQMCLPILIIFLIFLWGGETPCYSNLAEQFLLFRIGSIQVFINIKRYTVYLINKCAGIFFLTRPKVVRTTVPFQCELTALTISDPHRGRTGAVE
jgi:hypothetical protein